MEDPYIPILDFASDDDHYNHGQKLLNALETTGFVYILNHGIDGKLVKEALDVSGEFFRSEKEMKLPYKRPDGAELNSGYVPIGMERLSVFVDQENESREIREAFDYLPFDQENTPKETANFGPVLGTLYEACQKFSNSFLDILADALDPNVKGVFRKAHQNLGNSGNPTILRTLYYPAVDISKDQAENLTRCGTHTDYGTITLLFQDDVGGLEVENRDGKFVPAMPVEDAVLVNLGDLLQRWTSDRLRSTRHRVTIAPSGKPRQSIAFFLHPDEDFIVECLDGSRKYPLVSAGGYLRKQFGLTF